MIPSSRLTIVSTCCMCREHRMASNGWFQVAQNGRELSIEPMPARELDAAKSFVCSDACLQKIVQYYCNEIRGAHTIHGIQGKHEQV